MPDALDAAVARALIPLGADLSLARRRRGISMQSMAVRMGVSPKTVQRLEKGDATVAVGTVARALIVLGEADKLARLLDTARDDLGLQLMNQAVRKRIRAPRLAPSAKSGKSATGAM
jgi:transcriptional regulator with XRE-family HTH domain